MFYTSTSGNIKIPLSSDVIYDRRRLERLLAIVNLSVALSRLALILPTFHCITPASVIDSVKRRSHRESKSQLVALNSDAFCSNANTRMNTKWYKQVGPLTETRLVE